MEHRTNIKNIRSCLLGVRLHRRTYSQSLYLDHLFRKVYKLGFVWSMSGEDTKIPKTTLMIHVRMAGIKQTFGCSALRSYQRCHTFLPLLSCSHANREHTTPTIYHPTFSNCHVSRSLNRWSFPSQHYPPPRRASSSPLPIPPSRVACVNMTYPTI